jgi:hypothetical protein
MGEADDEVSQYKEHTWLSTRAHMALNTVITWPASARQTPDEGIERMVAVTPRHVTGVVPVVGAHHGNLAGE